MRFTLPRRARASRRPARSAAAAATVIGLAVAPLVALPGSASADPDSRLATFAERPRDAAVHAVDGEVPATVAQVGGSVVFGGSFTRSARSPGAPWASWTRRPSPSAPASPTSSAR
ncbi:MAG: hypothetical protein R2731_07050 [Nocardioides sp.]